jgi:hypothetical protein
MITKTCLSEKTSVRGLMLQVIDVYPTILQDVKIKTNIQLFFGLKPIFDLLGFTE